MILHRLLVGTGWVYDPESKCYSKGDWRVRIVSASVARLSREGAVGCLAVAANARKQDRVAQEIFSKITNHMREQQ